MAPSKLLFELLEKRNLLAGLVEVQLLDGNLFIKGNDAANVLEIQAVRDGGVLIVPDETTAINDPNKPGESLLIQRVSGELVADLGAGADQLVLAPAPMGLSGIKIETGEGDDLLQISGLATKGHVQLSNQAGSDRLEIEASKIGGTLSVSHGTSDDELGPGRNEGTSRTGASTRIEHSDLGDIRTSSTNVSHQFELNSNSIRRVPDGLTMITKDGSISNP